LILAGHEIQKWQKIVVTKICQYWQLLVVRPYSSTLNFCQWWYFLWSSTQKMVSTKKKSEENAIKMGNITENVDIYSLF